MLDASPTPLVKVRDLKMYFPIHTGVLRRHTGDVNRHSPSSTPLCGKVA